MFTIADLPPPSGKKTISYEVEVLAIPADSGMKLAIFPWSASYGAPSGEAKLANVGEPIIFGRRIIGDPKFWAVPIDKVAEIEKIQADSAGDVFEMANALQSWFDEPGHAVACSGAVIKPIFLVAEDNPTSKQTDQFFVKSLSADNCVVEKATSAAVGSEPEEGFGSFVLVSNVVALGCVCALAWWFCMRLQKSKQASGNDTLASAFHLM